jgi:tRNA-modifying protein YgfZ
MNFSTAERPPGSPVPGGLAAVFCAAPELGLLAFAGPDAEAFLQGQLSNDLKELLHGAVQLSSYNSAKGRMLATLLIWRDGSDSFRALVAADLAEPLRKRLSMYVLRSRLTVTDVSPAHALFGVAGPRAALAVRAAIGQAPDPGQVLVDDGATLVGMPDGRTIIVAPIASAESLRKQLAAEATAIPPEVWRWLGIRAGVPVIEAATQDLFVLQTANLDLLAGVSFHKGCYPGQEIVARTQYLGKLKERMHLFRVDGVPPPPPATKIYSALFGDQACGMVVDAAAAPDGGVDLLAILQMSALAAPLHLGAPDGPALAPLPLPYSLPAPVTPTRPKL